MKINGNEYRIKTMNAIELMALRSQIDFDNYEKVLKMYEIMLEKLEVEVNGKWLPVKTPGTKIYVPSGLENDVDTTEKLIMFVMEYVKSVFTKSDVSKKEQE